MADLLCYAYPMDYILVKANHFSQQELYDFLFGEGDHHASIYYSFSRFCRLFTNCDHLIRDLVHNSLGIKENAISEEKY